MYKSFMAAHTSKADSELIQILTDQLQPNSQKITWLLTTSEMLQKIYHKSWSTKSSAKTRMKTHTHTLSLSLSLSHLTWCDLEIHKKNTNKMSLSLSLSLNFALQKLIARRKIKRKGLCFFPRPQNIILSTRWREKCARKPNEAARGKKKTKTFAKHTLTTQLQQNQQSEQNSASSRAGERLAVFLKKRKKRIGEEFSPNFYLRNMISTY